MTQHSFLIWLSTALLISIAVISACNSTNPSIAPERLSHMTAVREKLKHEMGERYDQPVAASSDSQLQRGQKLFAQLCAGCHGPRGDGKGHVAEGIAGHPSNFTNPAEAAFYSEQARLQIIRKGISGTPMMGWENVLTEEDILAVYGYVRSLLVANSAFKKAE